MKKNCIGETFDRFSEDICSVCLCNSDMCGPLDKSCRLVGDMEELFNVCNEADRLKNSLLHLAQSEDYCFSSGCEDF